MSDYILLIDELLEQILNSSFYFFKKMGLTIFARQNGEDQVDFINKITMN